jgi:capsular exopolysaccharide synthesis family protein
MIDTILCNFTFGKIAGILKRKLIFIILITTIASVSLGYYSYWTSKTIYAAKVSMYVYSDPSYVSSSNVNVSNVEFTTAKNLVQSYMLVLKSNTVLEKVREKLNIDISINQLRNSIGAESVENTSVFYIYVYNEDPYISTEIANEIADIAPSQIARVIKSGGVEVIDYATLPTLPYSSTNIIKYTLIGGIGGFALSACLFLFFGLLDTTIRKKSEVSDVFTIPILGDVPMISDPTRRIKANKILGTETPFALVESYSRIRTNLMFTGKGETCPCFVVTSADQGDGKTLSCVNLAISFSQLGKKTLIIDADLRNPSVHKQFQVDEDSVGLSQYLAGMTKDIKYIETKIQDLYVLPAGIIPPNPMKLIASSRFDDLLSDMREEFEYIFIDMSPVGIVSDPILLAKRVTGYILVLRSGISKMTKEKYIVELLDQAETEISGFIYNASNPKSSDYGYKDYKSYKNCYIPAGKGMEA